MNTFWDRPCYKCKSHTCDLSCPDLDATLFFSKKSTELIKQKHQDGFVNKVICATARTAEFSEPLYEAQPQPQPKNPLSVLQIRDIRDTFDKDEPISLVAFARAIEAAHGIK